MQIVVLKETHPNEARVAVSPETVRKFIAQGCRVRIAAQAGKGAFIEDKDFQAAGAEIGENVSDADIVLSVRAPSPDVIGAMKESALLVGLLDPHRNADLMKAAAQAKVKAMALELVPRITRAQTMDVLSSQANLAGYRAVIEASQAFGRALPLMMTAAGTIAAARVFVMGAGVAGLQAIATARRLGAVVCATDVRLAAREQVQSLGAQFVMVDSEEARAAETAGGYAKEMSDDYKRAQAQLVAQTIAKQDIVITTAQIPGRAAPLLVTQEMVESMKPGSVIVDLAAEQGGNCALTVPGDVVVRGGVKIIGYTNFASLIAADASALYARNVFNFIAPMIKDGVLDDRQDEEIATAVTLTRAGEIVHPAFAVDLVRGESA